MIKWQAMSISQTFFQETWQQLMTFKITGVRSNQNKVWLIPKCLVFIKQGKRPSTNVQEFSISSRILILLIE